MTADPTVSQPPAHWPEELRAAFWTAVNAPTYDESAAATLALVRQLAGIVAEGEATQWPGSLADLIDPTRGAPAAVSVPPPATRADDQANLRDRIARAIFGAHSPGIDVWDTAGAHAQAVCRAEADAVLAVLPEPADRADRVAVLAEVADWLKAWRPEFFDRWAITEQERYEGGVDDAAAELRRLADEAQPVNELIDDYLRFLRGQGPEPDLSDLPPQQREVIAGQFEVVRALADRHPVLPPLDRDPVALRLGLHGDDHSCAESGCSGVSGPCVAGEQQNETPEAETVHGCPPDGSGLTPCCGRTPFELPLGDRISSEAPVTCPGKEA